MALKIWNIGKANARIDELEKQLAEKETEVLALAANPVELETELTQTKSDLATAKQTIGTLEAAAQASAAQVAKFTSDLASANAQLALVPAQVEASAAAKSVQIVASQGIPPIAIKVEANPAATAKPVPKGLSAQDRLKLERAPN
jgi:septal ring factor EnvC (AmiA/AmiB activator)